MDSESVMTATLAHFKQLSALKHGQPDQDAADNLPQQVDQVVAWLAHVDAKDYQLQDQIRNALFELGVQEQAAYWQLNNRLIQPLQQLMADTEKGGQVSGLLQKLQKSVASMQPPKRRTGWLDRLKLLFSWKQSAYQMWLETYPEKQTVVSGLVDRLKSEKKQLKRDNLILAGDHEALTAGVQKLSHSFDYVSLIEQKLKLAASGLDAERSTMIQDELLEPVQQRVIELQQQLLIARQAVMTVELIIKQNQTLIRDIDQTIMTTTAVLDVAAGVAMANNKQQQAQAKHAPIDTQKLQQAKAMIDETLAHLQQINQESSAAAEGINHHSQSSVDD